RGDMPDEITDTRNPTVAFPELQEMATYRVTLTVRDTITHHTNTITTLIDLEPYTWIIADTETTTATCTTTNDGSITVHATGGSGNYTFSLPGYTDNTTGHWPSVSNGTHEITVRDDLGCTATTTAEVAFLDGIVPSFHAYPATCNTSP